MYLASYFTPGHVAIDMGVFPSAGVREYACSGLYLVVDPGAGTAQSHIHRSPSTALIMILGANFNFGSRSQPLSKTVRNILGYLTFQRLSQMLLLRKNGTRDS